MSVACKINNNPNIYKTDSVKFNLNSIRFDFLNLKICETIEKTKSRRVQKRNHAKYGNEIVPSTEFAFVIIWEIGCIKTNCEKNWGRANKNFLFNV